jgi:hypothetical protein
MWYPQQPWYPPQQMCPPNAWDHAHQTAWRMQQQPPFAGPPFSGPPFAGQHFA